MSFRLIIKTGLSYWKKHPSQFILALLGIMLGVGVVTAIDLTNSSALKSFQHSVTTVSGKTTHRLISASGTIPEEDYFFLRSQLGIQNSAPVIEGYLKIIGEESKPFRVLGVDPFAERPFRNFLHQTPTPGIINSLLTEPNTILISEQGASDLDAKIGSEIPVLVGTRMIILKVAGLFKASNDFSAEVLRNLMIMDISTAQDLYTMHGRLSRIDLILKDPLVEDVLREERRRGISQSTRLQSIDENLQAGERLTRAFRVNLTALSLLTLVVGIFLIYNTVTFSVVQRFDLIGRMRVIGMTRSEVLNWILLEALMIGVLGTVLGLVLGVTLAGILLDQVTQTMNDLYFVQTVNSLNFSLFSLIKSIALGVGATLIAAYLPAREAASVKPVLVLKKSLTEEHQKIRFMILGGVGFLGMLAGFVTLQWGNEGLWVSYSGVFMLIIGSALLVPFLTLVFSRLFKPLSTRIFGVFGGMTLRGIESQLSRTGVAIAALTVAVASTNSLDLMVSSFRTAVSSWLQSQLRADIYLSPPSLLSNQNSQFIDNLLVNKYSSLPEVDFTSYYRRFQTESNGSRIHVHGVNLPPQGEQAFRFKEKLQSFDWKDFRNLSQVIVSEPLAFRKNLKSGDDLVLETPQGSQAFKVVGIFHDYAAEQGFALLSRKNLMRFWEDQTVNSMALYLKPGTNVRELVEQLENDLIETSGNVSNTSELPLNVRSNQELRQSSMAIFDRTFAITGILKLLLGGVAVIGIFSALMSVQLERSRELSVLRAIGMTPSEIGKMVYGQCALMGILAGLFALPTGILLAKVLIQVINLRSFGWSFPLMIDSQIIYKSIMIAFVAALAAGIYPVLKMSASSPALALRGE
ncbi:MAG: FtsX-like permease family protein [SAR324 cluster bacterium]|nr:FtsX-like permease family protein [SAR324 cluster bacterium]